MATADARARAAAAKRAAAAAKKKAETAKKNTAKITADRAESLKRTQTRAGKSSGNVAQRAKQNAGVKDGTIRLGASGKSYNIFDAKTQTWKRGQVVGAKKTETPTSGKNKKGVYGGPRKPTGKESSNTGPATFGIKNPTDGHLYRFGGPTSMETFRWNAKLGRFTKVS